MQSPGGNNPGDVPSRLPNRCSTLSLSQDAPKELGKARWEAVSQGSGTARGIGCRTLLLSPSKALSCAGGSRETGAKGSAGPSAVLCLPAGESDFGQ